MYSEASKCILKEKGVLAIPERLPRSGINEEIIFLVIAFYEGDEYSRLLQRANGCIICV